MTETTASDGFNSKPETRNPKPSALERRLLNDFQHDFPLSPTPYADMARALGVGEGEVLAALAHLKASGAISRVGAVIRPNTVGVSTLAAMAVPAARLEEVAALVSGCPEVNHNYEREHRLNLWFVVTAPDAARLAAVLDDIGARTGLEVLAFPMLADYHIDLGFDLRWT
jgi:DNA-binding Lrp family transcriptional regulator